MSADAGWDEPIPYHLAETCDDPNCIEASQEAQA